MILWPLTFLVIRPSLDIFVLCACDATQMASDTHRLHQKALEGQVRAQIVVNDTLVEQTPWNRDKLASLKAQSAHAANHGRSRVPRVCPSEHCAAR